MIVRLAPFLGTETLDELVRHAVDGDVQWDVISGIAPFISKETLNHLVDKSIEGSLDIKELVSLCSFSRQRPSG